jgi:DNA invertase Pin-like site-specific DNA recombinase
LASNQMDAIREYAKRHGMQIVKEYSDEGKSGVNIQDRESLAQMIRDVQSGQINFSAILLYDVSRWGRFQDADESAYYEYICRRPGFRFIIAPSNLKVRPSSSPRLSNASKIIRANENGLN